MSQQRGSAERSPERDGATSTAQSPIAAGATPAPALGQAEPPQQPGAWARAPRPFPSSGPGSSSRPPRLILCRKVQKTAAGAEPKPGDPKSSTGGPGGGQGGTLLHRAGAGDTARSPPKPHTWAGPPARESRSLPHGRPKPHRAPMGDAHQHSAFGSTATCSASHRTAGKRVELVTPQRLAQKRAGWEAHKARQGGGSPQTPGPAAPAAPPTVGWGAGAPEGAAPGPGLVSLVFREFWSP